MRGGPAEVPPACCTMRSLSYSTMEARHASKVISCATTQEKYLPVGSRGERMTGSYKETAFKSCIFPNMAEAQGVLP